MFQTEDTLISNDEDLLQWARHSTTLALDNAVERDKIANHRLYCFGQIFVRSRFNLCHHIEAFLWLSSAATEGLVTPVVIIRELLPV